MLSAFNAIMVMMKARGDAVAQISQPVEHEAQMLSQQIERMYKGFQYQDRINQMMTLLQDDVERLHLAMIQPGTAVGAEQWLSRLESTYVMTEQRQQHNKVASQASGDDELTFF